MHIYKIVNKENFQFYIGKTQEKEIETRFKGHVSTAKRRKERKQKLSHIHAAIIKYGEDNFFIESIEQIHENPSLLSEREIFWIAELQPKYNMTKGGEGGGGTKTGSKFSDNHKKSISDVKKGMIWVYHKETLEEKCLFRNSTVYEPWICGRSPKTKHGGRRGLYGGNRSIKIAKANKGRLPWNTGKKWSEEVKKKISETHKKNHLTK